MLASGGILAACGSDASTTKGSTTTTRPGGGPAASRTAVVDGVKLQVADWVIAENARPGTIDWILGGYPPDNEALEGFASATSVATGGKVDLFVVEVTADGSSCDVYVVQGGSRHKAETLNK